MHEDYFILNASRLNLSEENIASLIDISKKKIDWPKFERKAYTHRVDSLIYYSLKNHNLLHLIPKAVFKRFQKNYFSIAYLNSVFLDEVEKLSVLIDDKIVILKGIDLIQSLYPNIAIRSMVDIDILVDSNNDLTIWNKLKINGYKESDSGIFKSQLHIYQPDPNDRFHTLPDLTNGKCQLEIHWNIFQKACFSNESNMAWEKSVPFSESKNIYRLTNEFMLVHLCSHLYFHKHQYVNLQMVCDINEFILKYENIIKWHEISDICSNQELKMAMNTALTYTNYLLGTPIPQNFINRKLIDEKEINLDTLLKGENHNSHLHDYLTVLKSFDKPGDRIKYVFRTILPVKAWMKENYNTKSDLGLAIAYLKYWFFQISVHLFK